MKGFAGTLGLVGLAACLMASSPAHALGPLDGAATPLGDPTPNAPNGIRAVFATRILDSLAGFEIGVELDVFEVEIPPAGPHTASELRTAPPAVRQLFEAAVRDALLQEAGRVAPDARVSLLRLDFTYGGEDYDADPYHPGVHIEGALRADFTPEFFGLAAGTQTPPREIARAFLYSGGAYGVSKEVQVPAGYDVRHIVGVPDFLELSAPGRPGLPRVEFRKDNFDGAEPGTVRLDFTVRLREDAVPGNVVDGPLVKAAFVVDDVTPAWKQVVPFLSGEYMGHLELEILVNSLDAGLFGRYPLPAQLSLPQVSADLLRVAVREGLVQPADVEAFFDGLIRRSLEEGFGPDIELGFDWDAFARSLNDPIGGADGATVAPLLVRAQATLPFTSSKMFVASSVGRVFSMTLGMSGSFELANDGIWNADYTVAYPRGVSVDVTDSQGLVEKKDWGEREGFHVYLAKGASTTVQVSGRTAFDPVVFSVGLLEAGLILLALWGAWAKFRSFRRGRTPAAAA